MFVKILWISLVGGMINLDEHTVIQSMICRPIVSGPIIGCLLGDIRTGFIFGIILELILFNVLPVGAAMPINSSVIAILSVGLSVLISKANQIPIDSPFIVWILACVIPLGIVFKELEKINRRINIQLMHFTEKRISKGELNSVERVTFLGILISFVKAFVFIMIFMHGGLYLLPRLFVMFPEKVMEGFKIAYVLIFILGMAVTVNTFRVRIGKKIKKDNVN